MIPPVTGVIVGRGRTCVRPDVGCRSPWRPDGERPGAEPVVRAAAEGASGSAPHVPRGPVPNPSSPGPKPNDASGPRTLGAMSPHVLVLGGTTEARELATELTARPGT